MNFIINKYITVPATYNQLKMSKMVDRLYAQHYINNHINPFYDSKFTPEVFIEYSKLQNYNNSGLDFLQYYFMNFATISDIQLCIELSKIKKLFDVFNINAMPTDLVAWRLSLAPIMDNQMLKTIYGRYTYSLKIKDIIDKIPEKVYEAQEQLAFYQKQRDDSGYQKVETLKYIHAYETTHKFIVNILTEADELIKWRKEYLNHYAVNFNNYYFSTELLAEDVFD